MELLNESERRFTKKLCDAMIPVMIEQFWEIWLEAKKECAEKKSKQLTLVFQELLRGVKTWNSSISLKNTEAIVKSQPLFPNLLAAVFVIHVKILSAIRTDKKSKKIRIKLPANDVFVQRCYENCARNIYDDPFIITEPNSDELRKSELKKRFFDEICTVIEDLVPTAEILATYLPMPGPGEDLDMEHDENDPEADEDVPDLMNEDPAPDAPTEPMETDGLPENNAQPENTGNMEFGKTPGGVDTTVTTSATMSPPVVEKMEQTLFDDAADSKKGAHPARIQKLG